MNQSQIEATFDDLEETVCVHIDKIAETLDRTENVKDYGWDNGTLEVWVGRGMLHSETLDELRQWGVEVNYIQFENNHINFTRRD